MILLAYAGGIFTGLCIAVLMGAIISRRRKSTETEELLPVSDLLFNMEQTFENVRYHTEGSTILAVRTDRDEDEKCIKYQDYIMKTPNGRYFRQMHSIWGLEGIFPLTKEEAMGYFNRIKDQRVSFEEAFGEGLIEA